MKISEVLEAYNKAIDELREEKGIIAKGHFISIADIKKSMGPYKQVYVNILYHDGNKNLNYPFAGAQVMDRCPIDKEGAMLTKCELAALTKFFIYCNNQEVFNSVLNNTYDRTK